MKAIFTLAMTTAMTAAAFAGDFQTDTFKTVGGKDVVITAIKHASLRIQYDGLEIQVDPVAKYAPETDYTKFPKADVVLVTHEHFDHFDREAIAVLKKKVLFPYHYSSTPIKNGVELLAGSGIDVRIRNYQ